ncbi:MAG: undecaprenyldiphospho-muramoylpentapeptide beta-N-acetylglucosaminyltransferase [Acidimicrobiales bacterium]|nr:undecaprenyldiphospho-muramoylpentapeptide beta-N-acetylglucosaminyltransferase [Acidimicrobiales bacterium]
MARPWAVIAGGGTAGHVSPGLAVADALVDRGVPRDAILWIGSRRGLETTLVPDAGIELIALPGRGIQRRLAPANIAAVGGLLYAIARTVVAFARRRPAVVLALGGYASVPGVVAAIVWRVPIVITEQNAVPSAANRLAARFAKACAMPFPDGPMPNAVWTGNPVRPAIVAVDRTRDRDDARRRLGVGPEQTMVLVMGGSLGARRINDALYDALPAWAGRTDLVVHHIAGARDHADLVTRRPLDAGDPLDHRLIRYEDDMASVYAATDLVLCRAGGNSVAEIAVVGLPSVLVPLPGAPADHQTHNAAALAAPGGAIVVADADLDGARLRSEIDALVAVPERRAAMAAAAASVGRSDAPAAIAALLETHAARPQPGGPDDT